MFIIEAPYPALQTTTILPNPQFSDQEGLATSIVRKTAMNGTRYTYVKYRNRRRLRWTFSLSRNKGLELRAFLMSYFASKLRITDHRGRVWLGHFTSNPFELETTRKAGPPIDGWPRGEMQVIDLEFEGERQ